jgi:hypothetical protein
VANERILLDIPSNAPALNFEETATALAQVVQQSEPRFAVGIFGGWGSGKTTLMQAIERKLPKDRILCPWFNAWRYEREPHLIVPLLDTIRGAVVEWAASQQPAVAERAKGVAARIGRVVRALAKGLSAEFSVPGFAKLSYALEPAIDQLMDDAAHGDSEPQSLYYASFEELRRAFEQLTGGGIDRIVVFIDDLDRCLPSNALDVIESMKLFFDLPGFVFVVGLDQTVLEQAVRVRLTGMVGSESPASGVADRRVRATEREYVKKIFQVPYELPPMAAERLDELLASIYGAAQLNGGQLTDLRQRVRPYLDHVAVEGQVNPREVKRFINAYTLQMMVRPQLDRDTVLAVQTLVFRDDWSLYEILREETDALPGAIKGYRDGEATALVDLWPEIGPLPTGLARFLRSDEAAPLARGGLRMYLTSVEATVRTERWLSESYSLVGRLRRTARTVPQLIEQGAPAEQIETVSRQLSDLIVHLRQLTDDVGASDRIRAHLDDFTTALRAVHGGMPAERANKWSTDAAAIIAEVQRELRLLRSLTRNAPTT